MVTALVILLIAFGSVLAAGLPIVVALFGLGVALAASSLLSHVFMVPEWAPQLVTMIGIGVGIDYALFIVIRYRAALAAGQEPEDAVVTRHHHRRPSRPLRGRHRGDLARSAWPPWASSTSTAPPP